MILGLLRSLLNAFGLGRHKDRVVVIRESETFDIQDPATGAVQRYEARSQLPPSVREALDKALSQRGTPGEPRTVVQEEYRVMDQDGNLRVYKSLDEMPPEIRALLGKKP